ncbi:MAG: hypothetical protein PVG39_02290 [Desulfobacteraceae bacterium]|jgi:hypothetical protein
MGGMLWTLGFGLFCAVATFVGCVIWAKRDKKSWEKTLHFFDVQAKVDELLNKTDLDEKAKETLTSIRNGVDEIVKK